mmetsp:Transcript_35271/g.91645  ORF Transcript_35271/g.91645 Transcript_35271/m.91645 type:complete len:80 (+) Transcript_35271:237-476(+)
MYVCACTCVCVYVCMCVCVYVCKCAIVGGWTMQSMRHARMHACTYVSRQEGGKSGRRSEAPGYIYSTFFFNSLLSARLS